MEKKSIWKSKQLWFNVLSILIMAVDQLAGTNMIPKDIAATIVGFTNIALRLVTTQGVKL